MKDAHPGREVSRDRDRARSDRARTARARRTAAPGAISSAGVLSSWTRTVSRRRARWCRFRSGRRDTSTRCGCRRPGRGRNPPAAGRASGPGGAVDRRGRRPVATATRMIRSFSATSRRPPPSLSSPTARQGLTAQAKQTSLRIALPIPAMTRWSSSVSPTSRSGPARAGALPRRRDRSPLAADRGRAASAPGRCAPETR